MAADDPKDPLSRYLEAAMGFTEITRKRAEKVVRGLMKQGEAAGNPKELAEHLLERSQENREALVTLVRGETKRAMKAMGLATTNDVERLEQQVATLRRQLAEAQDAAGESGAGKAQGRSSDKARGRSTKKAQGRSTKKAGKKAQARSTKKAQGRSTKKTTKKKS